MSAFIRDEYIDEYIIQESILTYRYMLLFFSLQSANPYIVKLSILDDELALTVSTEVFSNISAI